MGKVIRKRGAWWIDYRDNGVRHRKMIGPDKKTAERILTKIETQIIENRYLDIKKEPRVKFENFVQEYLKIHSERKKSYHTDLQITNRLTGHFGGKYLFEIRQIDIERFKTERAKQVKPGTVNRELSVLKSMFSRAVEWGRAIENSAKGVKKFKENNRRQRCLAYEEEDNLLANCNERIKPIVLVALHTGMRKGEILKLKWQDVDIQNRVIHLLDTKNGEARDVPMNNTVIDTLRKIIKHLTSEYIFCNKGGKLYGDIKKSFLSAIEKAGIINFRFHDLRHTFISRLMMAGVDLASLTEIAGHKSVKMTIRYSHPSPDHKLQVVGILDREMGTRWAPSFSNTPTIKTPILQLVENK